MAGDASPEASPCSKEGEPFAPAGAKALAPLKAAVTKYAAPVDADLSFTTTESPASRRLIAASDIGVLRMYLRSSGGKNGAARPPLVYVPFELGAAVLGPVHDVAQDHRPDFA